MVIDTNKLRDWLEAIRPEDPDTEEGYIANSLIDATLDDVREVEAGGCD